MLLYQVVTRQTLCMNSDFKFISLWDTVLVNMPSSVWVNQKQLNWMTALNKSKIQEKYSYLDRRIYLHMSFTPQSLDLLAFFEMQSTFRPKIGNYLTPTVMRPKYCRKVAFLFVFVTKHKNENNWAMPSFFEMASEICPEIQNWRSRSANVSRFCQTFTSFILYKSSGLLPKLYDFHSHCLWRFLHIRKSSASRRLLYFTDYQTLCKGYNHYFIGENVTFNITVVRKVIFDSHNETLSRDTTWFENNNL